MKKLLLIFALLITTSTFAQLKGTFLGGNINRHDDEVKIFYRSDLDQYHLYVGVEALDGSTLFYVWRISGSEINIIFNRLQTMSAQGKDGLSSYGPYKSISKHLGKNYLFLYKEGNDVYIGSNDEFDHKNADWETDLPLRNFTGKVLYPAVRHYHNN